MGMDWVITELSRAMGTGTSLWRRKPKGMGAKAKMKNGQASKAEHDSRIEAPEGAEVEADPGSDYLITVQVDEQFESKVDADALHRLAIGVLKAEGKAGPLELGVVVTTDDEVHALNKEYLGHDYK